MSVTSVFETVQGTLKADGTRPFVEQFRSFKVEYDAESRHCRFKDGVELPTTTFESVLRLNSEKPWQFWGGVRLSPCRCFFVKPNKEPLLPTTISRILGRADTPIRMLLPYLSIPNGQVKNYLNACRAANNLKEQSRVAVVGSKAVEGGGLWHQYFVLYLQMLYNNIIVDFYDYSERARVQSYIQGSSFVSCEWLEEGFSQSMASNYDLIIDDAWSYSSGPGLHLDYQGQYSWKGSSEVGEGFEPFLHPTETRKFSTQPLSYVHTGCDCPTCRVIKASVKTYSQYRYIRMLCSRLGYTPTCEGLGDQSDMRKAGEVLRDLLSDSIIDLRIGVMIRAAMSVSEEIPIEFKEGKLRQSEGVPVFLPINRKEPRSEEVFSLPEYTWLTGKRILFCGVPSTILGRTKIKSGGTGSAAPHDAEVVFVNSIEVWHHQQSSPVVYAPYTPESIQKHFPDWHSTGRKVSSMWEYVRQQLAPPLLKVRTQGQFCRSTLGPVHPIFPYLDVSIVGSLLQDKGLPTLPLRFFSLELQEGTMVVVPFKPSDWRRSIWVNEHNEWGRLITAIEHLGYYDGFMYAAVPLPWNMTKDEVEEVEKRIPRKLSVWRNKENMIFRQVISKRRWLIEGLDPMEVLPSQNEFVRMGSLTLYDIHRSELAHPISYEFCCPEIIEEWGMSLTMEYHQGFLHIKDTINRIKAVYAEG